jgi:hypothetical protein
LSALREDLLQMFQDVMMFDRLHGRRSVKFEDAELLNRLSVGKALDMARTERYAPDAGKHRGQMRNDKQQTRLLVVVVVG